LVPSHTPVVVAVSVAVAVAGLKGTIGKCNLRLGVTPGDGDGDGNGYGYVLEAMVGH
jgi:hypothetical protein